MAAPNPVRIIPSTSGNMRAGGEYVIRDEFTTDRAAGAVNGTAAEPGPGTRTVVDTESKLTIASGALTFAGGKASPAWGDPGLWLSAVVRVPGRLLKATLTKTAGATSFSVGFDNGVAGVVSTSGIQLGSTSVASSEIGLTVGSYTPDAVLQCAVALRTTGAFLFTKLVAGYWILVWRDDAGTNATLYPAASNYNAVAALDFLRVPLARWLPTPLVSHGFGSTFGTSDGLGHAEGVAGGIGAGGSGVTFSNAGATWSVSGGKAINTPTLGVTELVTNGNMETGDPPTGWTGNGSATLDGVADERTGGAGAQSLSAVRGTEDTVAYRTTAMTAGIWMRASGWTKSVSGAQVRIAEGSGAWTSAYNTQNSWVLAQATGRHVWDAGAAYWRCQVRTTAGAEGRFDDFSVKALTLSELISVSNLACADVLAGVAITRSDAAFQVGLALSWDSPTSPASGVLVFMDQSKIQVDKYVAGTWSNVSNTAYTYSAGARLVVQKSGTSYRTYYNNALVKADTIADAGILSNTYHGLFSTDASNTFDDLAIYATGTSNEYAALDAF